MTGRAQVEDYLETGMHWPLFAELAAHHGVQAVPPRWRLSSTKGEGTSFNATDMVSRSYRLFEANPEARRLIGGVLAADRAVPVD